MLTKLINPIFLVFYNFYTGVYAHLRKKRSQYDMEQLDDHLLDDIGFRREEGKVVPATELRVVENAQLVCEQQRKVRRRYAYLIRRRRRTYKSFFSEE